MDARRTLGVTLASVYSTFSDPLAEPWPTILLSGKIISKSKFYTFHERLWWVIFREV